MSGISVALSIVGGPGLVVHVESVALAAEAFAEKGYGSRQGRYGNLIVERLTCGHFAWHRCTFNYFTESMAAARVGRRRRCGECSGSPDDFDIASVLGALEAAPEKQFFGETW